MSFDFELRRDLKTLLLIPALFLSFDFLQPWFITTFTLLLLYTSFFKPWKFVAYANFICTYFIFKTVGFFIVPETMVPNLAVYLTSQLMLGKRNKENEFYLIFLWLASFAIFSSGLYYLLYSFSVLLILFIIDDAQSSLSLKNILLSFWRYKKQFFIISVITIVLFIFFPRFYQFLPTANIIPQGKIGYNDKIDNSTTSNLQLSSQIAFYAELNTILPPDALYWRGRVLDQTDGYNWKQGKAPLQMMNFEKPKKSIIYNIKYEQNFNGDIILLDRPYKILDSNLGYYTDRINNTYSSYSKKKKMYVQAESVIRPNYNNELKTKVLNHFLQLPGFIPKEVKKFNELIKDSDPTKILANFRQLVVREGYTYTLKPGPLPTMSDFIRAKRGYCSHYASLFALIMRINQVPARLVSGFQGGQYNDVGNFYMVKSNDAHVWVEFYHQGKWQSVDPTAFVSPDRINLGGQQFLTSGISQAEEKERNFLLKPFYEFKSFFDTVNFKVSLFLDSYDRGKQKSLSQTFNLSRRMFYFAGFVILNLIIGLFFYFNKWKGRTTYHPADKLLLPLHKQLDKKLLPLKKVQDLSRFQDEFTNQSEYRELIQLYQEMRYGFKNHEERIRTLIKNLKGQKL